MVLEDIYFRKFGFGSDSEELHPYMKVKTYTIFVDSMDLRERMVCPVKQRRTRRRANIISQATY
jgi:hypothetical protein